MTDITGAFSEDHRRCDEAFVLIEQAVTKGDWDRAASDTEAFIEKMERHLGVEEQQLFPALQQANPGAGGPVQVMLMEHEQMRQLFEQLRDAVQRKSAPDCLGVTETLLLTMQQHNMKEEGILYPMADRSMGSQGSELARNLQGG